MQTKYPTHIDRRTCRRTVPMKVLVLGMSRTGTDSMKKALLRLGYCDTYHGYTAATENPRDCEMWLDAMAAKWDAVGKPFGRAEWDQLLGHCQAVTDIPAAVFAKELIEAYPEAKVVLTNRDAEEWHRSVQATLLNNVFHPWSSVIDTLATLTHSPNRFTRKMFIRAFTDYFRGDFKRHGISVYHAHYKMILVKMYCKWVVHVLFATALPVMFTNGRSTASDQQNLVLPIPSLQNPVGEKFIGTAVEAKPLSPKQVYSPQTFNMHQDGGNTGISNQRGPLGVNLEVSSALESLHILLWSKSGQMVAGYTSIGPAGLKWGLAAVDDDTLRIQYTWYPETDGQTLNVAYMGLLLDKDQIVVTSKEGQIYVVQLSDSNGSPSLALLQTFNLTSVLGCDELLLNAMYDTQDNLWFTSGGLRSQDEGGHGDPAQNSTTIGYIEPTGILHVLHLSNEMVENGIAVTGTTVYIITGPSGANDHQDATGTLYSLAPGPGTSIRTLWAIPYSAGDTKKPGAFARGSGATPALLGDQQRGALLPRLFAVSLYGSGLSNVDISPLVHDDGDIYGVMLCNDFNAPTLYYVDSGLDGDFNNLTVMAPGVVRVNITSDGTSCKIAWENDIRMQSVPILSAQNGLVYGYTQSVSSSLEGLFEWYAVAFRWETGEEVWRARAGAGGTYNDDYQPGALGPDGSFYQSVIGGLVRFKDSA
ncbi:sulfotransferase family protein [Aspergillus affinis]|uniref:sulfotransferase family protein n=1 Tax=Aspergillus affinis TaxID=1070780 RepID=UPI0022FE15B0|nr:uncharacterized protein KD926_011064 [Aspergillus affinis]KAI9044891.1 hypothetical protein KD926_011064 [Aspergillus affinis]